MIRYFTLKEGNRKVHGCVIEVDPSNLECMLKDYSGSSLKFKFIEKENGNLVYEIIHPNQEFQSGGGPTILTPASGPGYVDVAPPDKIPIIVTKEGDMKIQRGYKGKRFFLDKISKKKADSIKSDAFNWEMQRLWILGY